MISIPLNPNSPIPMYLQIYNYIKEEILSGRLSAPDKLPSARSLASFLSVSRSTVDTAYQQLVAEGYIEAKEKRGFFVNSITHTSSFHFSDEETPSPSIISSTKEYLYDFNPDGIDLEHFPYSVWKSIGKNQLDSPVNFISAPPFGLYELRQSIASYLLGARGVHCQPEQIIVGAGLDHLLQMLCVFFQQKPVIAMEEPGYKSARNVLETNGYAIESIPLTDGSIALDQLYQSPASICYVTPSHQFPLGTVMPVYKRQQLLDWASLKEDRYIIEDDHDSEFRYVGKPIPALQSIDCHEKVIYIGTFSKAISPAIRTGYMVLPPHLCHAYEEICGGYACPVSRISQGILNDFLRLGYFEKHLNRMRKNYRVRHDTMIHELKKNFPASLFSFSGDHAGLYILLHYHGSTKEDVLLERAEKNGIKLRTLKEYYAKLPADYHPVFLLGFASMPEETIAKGISMLAKKVFLC